MSPQLAQIAPLVDLGTMGPHGPLWAAVLIGIAFGCHRIGAIKHGIFRLGPGGGGRQHQG